MSQVRDLRQWGEASKEYVDEIVEALKDRYDIDEVVIDLETGNN